MINLVEYWVRQGVLTQSDGQWRLTNRLATLADGLPTGLQDMLEKQLERLSPEEQLLLEAASVSGATFSAAVLAVSLDKESEQIEAQCESLANRKQFIRSHGVETLPTGAITNTYEFSHALYQQLLYSRSPASRRVRPHRRLAEALEGLSGDRAHERAADLAIQFERGRDPRKAVHYLAQAARNAAQRSAHQQAVALFTKALDLLSTLPETPERAPHELRLHLALGNSLLATAGYAAPEVEQVFFRARDLCLQMGNPPQLLPVMLVLGTILLVRAEFPAARAFTQQLLALLEKAPPSLVCAAYAGIGLVFLNLGELATARDYIERGVQFYAPRHHNPLALQDPGVVSLAHAALVLWHQGYLDQAEARSQEALHLAQQLDHPFSRAFALCFAVWLQRLRRDDQAVREYTEMLLALAREQGFTHWETQGMIAQGWTLAARGRVEEGIARIRQGLAALQAAGTRFERQRVLVSLADIYATVGKKMEGLAVIEEALSDIDTTQQYLFAAELYRLKGELTLMQSSAQSRRSRVRKSSRLQAPSSKSKNTAPRSLTSNVQSAAEASFLKALAIARQQEAKSWELRSMMSVARLWNAQGKAKEARQLLTEIYGWFTEGFATAALRDARALLDTLA